MNPMLLSNVSIADEVKKTYSLDATTVINPPRGALSEVIWTLASEHPSWKFVAVRGNGMGAISGSFVAYEFAVYLDKELLGRIESSKYRCEWSIGITNPRIARQLDRGATTYTKNVSKAISTVRKLFSPMDVQERVESAVTRVDHEAKAAEWSAKRKVRGASEILEDSIRSFALTLKRDEFEVYLNTKPNAHHLTTALHSYERDSVDLEVIMDVKGAIAANAVCTVILNDGKYIVKYKAVTNVYDDLNLPEDVRKKLGLLKLVTDGQMISSIGYRISDQLFVLLIE